MSKKNRLANRELRKQRAMKPYKVIALTNVKASEFTSADDAAENALFASPLPHDERQDLVPASMLHFISERLGGTFHPEALRKAIIRTALGEAGDLVVGTTEGRELSISISNSKYRWECSDDFLARKANAIFMEVLTKVRAKAHSTGMNVPGYKPFPAEVEAAFLRRPLRGDFPTTDDSAMTRTVPLLLLQALAAGHTVTVRAA